MGDTAIDIGYFKAFDTIVGDVGHQIDVVDVELAVFLSFGIDFAEELDLCVIEVFTHFLNHPDVTEEFGTQVTIAHHRLTDHTQMGVNQLDDLVLRTDLTGSHLVKLVAQTF